MILTLFVVCCTMNACSPNQEDASHNSTAQNCETLKKDLSELADEQEFHLIAAFHEEETRSANRLNIKANRENYKINKEELHKVELKLQTFVKKHDIAMDLTKEQRKALELSEDEKEIIKYDNNRCEQFIKRAYTGEFYDYLNDIYNRNRCEFSKDEIIENTSLKLHEKIRLLYIKNLVNAINLSKIQTRGSNGHTWYIYGNEHTVPQSTMDYCSSIRSEEYKECLKDAVIPNVIGSGIDGIIAYLSKKAAGASWGALIYTAYEYANCLNQADQHYTSCINSNKK